MAQTGPCRTQSLSGTGRQTPGNARVVAHPRKKQGLGDPGEWVYPYPRQDLLPKAGGDSLPIYHIPPGAKVVGAAVLILQVVGVLPDVDAKQRGLAGHQRAILVGAANNFERARLIGNQPGPAAPKALEAGIVDLRLQGGEIAKG